MCMFCAAVPATVALGAAAKAKQKEAQHQETTVTHIPNWVATLPAEKVTLVVIASLMAGSVLYHSQISPV